MPTAASPSKLFLWDKRTLYLGPLLEEISLSYGAATLIISLDDPIQFHDDSSTKYDRCHSLLVAAGKRITINTGQSNIAICYLDPMGKDFHYLTCLMKKTNNDIYCHVNNTINFTSTFELLYKQKHTSESAYEVLEQVFNYPSYFDHPSDYLEKTKTYKQDARIENVISLIKSHILDNLSIEDLARSVNLSETHLMQLFKIQTGIPIRRYRLWHRLFTSGIKLSQGYNLTQAASESGFNDSAHFAKTFKDMLGMSASSILMQPNGLELIAPTIDPPTIDAAIHCELETVLN